MSDFKVGDRVRVTAPHGGLFYTCNAGKSGVVHNTTESAVWVTFDECGSRDYGPAEDLSLIVAATEAPLPVAVSVAQKLAQIETLVAEIKAILV